MRLIEKVKPFLDERGDTRKYRWAIVSVALFCLLRFVLHYASEIRRGGHPWKTGDWLINYQGGFIRRGLIGQLLYESAAQGLDLLWTTFALQAAIYAAIAFLVLKLYFKERRNPYWLLLIFSPAFVFLFPLSSYPGGFRKEILVFLALGLFVGSLAGPKIRHWLAIPALAIYAAAVFSHELAAFCLIFFLYPLYEYLRHEPAEKALGRLYYPAFVAAASAGLLFSMSRQGSSEQAAAVCRSIVAAGAGPAACDGAIKWLGYDAGYGIGQVVQSLPAYVPVYGLLLLLALLPVFLSDWWKTRKLFLALAFLSIAPLCVVAVDWGRWIHIYVTGVFMIMLHDSCRTEVRTLAVDIKWAIAYCALWALPHYFTSEPKLGVLGWPYAALRKLPALLGY